jgi:hypothetical protein
MTPRLARRSSADTAYNRPVQNFRHHLSHIGRWVLVWFVLFVGVSVASPLVKPAGAQMICVAGGMKMLATGPDGADAKLELGMDCPLCAPVMTPPAAHTPVRLAPDGLWHAMRPLWLAHIASLSGAPLPPRGPPVFS